MKGTKSPNNIGFDNQSPFTKLMKELQEIASATVM